MRRRDNPAAGLLRGDDLRQPESGDEGVEMDDVGVRVAQPAVETTRGAGVGPFGSHRCRFGASAAARPRPRGLARLIARRDTSPPAARFHRIAKLAAPRTRSCTSRSASCVGSPPGTQARRWHEAPPWPHARNEGRRARASRRPRASCAAGRAGCRRGCRGSTSRAPEQSTTFANRFVKTHCTSTAAIRPAGCDAAHVTHRRACTSVSRGVTGGRPPGKRVAPAAPEVVQPVAQGDATPRSGYQANAPAAAPHVLERPPGDVVRAVAFGLLALLGRQRTVRRLQGAPHGRDVRHFALRLDRLRHLPRMHAVPEQIGGSSRTFTCAQARIQNR